VGKGKILDDCKVRALDSRSATILFGQLQRHRVKVDGERPGGPGEKTHGVIEGSRESPHGS